MSDEAFNTFASEKPKPTSSGLMEDFDKMLDHIQAPPENPIKHDTPSGDKPEESSKPEEEEKAEDNTVKEDSKPKKEVPAEAPRAEETGEDDSGEKLSDLTPDAPAEEDTPEEPADSKENKKDAPKDDQEQDGDKFENAKKDLEEELKDPNLSPRRRKSLERVLGNNNHLKKQLQESKDKISQLEESSKEIETLKTQLNELQENPPVSPVSEDEKKELQMLRRKYDLSKDEEFNKKFTDEIQSKESAIEDILAQNGLRESGSEGQLTIESIRKAGGFSAYVKKYPEVYEQITEAIPSQSSRLIDTLMADQMATERAKEIAIRDEVAKADEYFAKRADEMSKTAEQTKAEQEAQLQKIQDIKKFVVESEKLGDQENFLKDKKYQSKFDLAMGATNPEQLAEVAIEAAYAFKLRDEIADKDAKIKELEEEIANISEAGKVTKKRQAPAATPKPKPAPTERTTPSLSFDATLNSIASSR